MVLKDRRRPFSPLLTMPSDHSRSLQRAADLATAGCPFVTVTLLSVRGSAPQIIGAKAVITTRNGIEAGTVGGGKVEAAALRHALDLLSQPPPSPCEIVTWNLQKDIGMTCGGEVRFLFEIHASDSWQIVVFGAGHIAQRFVPLLLTLECHVTCVDPRQEWLDRLPADPRLRLVRTDDMPGEVERLPARAFFTLMTQGHATDVPILSRILTTRDAPFVGVIGSAQKALVIKKDLRALGISEEKIASYHCPLGLPIGNNTPAEIAISLAAQLLQYRDAPDTAHQTESAEPDEASGREPHTIFQNHR